MIPFLIALALSLPPLVPSHTTDRLRSVREAFIKVNPPPAWCATYVVRDGKIQLYDTDGACDVDHICPIACGGPDVVENMQWMDSKKNRSKGADCTACAGIRKGNAQ